MSREAFPELPPDSLAHIENFPPELHASTEKQLLTLSHTALHEVGSGDEPIPQVELGEEHQPHIDLVARQMETTSRLLSSAQDELRTNGVDGHEVSFEQLAEKAKEIAVRSAKEAKQAGDAESAIKSLESLLVIESFGATSSNDQTKRSKSIVRKIVAEGLATEFVEATHESFGLVALQEHNPVPLNTIAKESPKLLRAASSIDFKDDFSDIEKTQPKSDISDLSCGDLLALAKMSEAEHPDTGASRDLLKQALKSAATEQVEPEDLVETLSKASEVSLNDEMFSALSNLRIRRQAGASEYRENDMNTGRLDETIVKLVQKGQTEVASAMISSSPEETDHLMSAVERVAADETEASQLTSTLEKLSQDKQAELRQRLQSTGVSESTVDWVIQATADPDSAANIPTEFWQKLEANDSLKEMLTSGGDDLARSAEALSTIDSSGLAEHSGLLLQKVLRLGDSEKANAYLASIRGALDVLGVQQKSQEGQDVDIPRALKDLAIFEDPAAALEAAKTLYGAEDYLKELRSLHDLVEPQYDKLATFRTEDISALGILRDYCATTGIKDSYIKDISASLMGSDDPIGRAQSIAEGLRSANITADTNLNLFFEMANQEDPISLGRAISMLEASLTDIGDTVRQDIFKKTVSSQSPEKTALLIVRTQKELQNQQLTIEDIGVGRLYEAMSIVDNAEDTKAIERYCSNCKIQLECEGAFQKYLQPVRELGDRKSLDIEKQPKLADLPELRARFEHLGISPELAGGMLDSWLTYSALRKLGNIDSTLVEQGKQLVEQAEAITNYVERFGSEETIALTNIFGIYNFIRYKPEQLHNQLLSWQSGELPTKNVVVSARADWNGAISDSGTSFERVLGEEGLFCFEVNDRVELARVAVAIGNRERSMGREPEEVNGLKNFIINGHANPKGILLGTRGQHLDATDYKQEPLNGQRANTYRRHLGSNFRVILKACSTAGEVENGKNIAEAISDYHEVHVVGSSVATNGAIIIEPDGEVRFNGGGMLGTAYREE
ncbi:MAG: hypothetical protein WCJ24_00925 [Candidatus Saccharibacteria bacterium]